MANKISNGDFELGGLEWSLHNAVVQDGVGVGGSKGLFVSGAGGYYRYEGDLVELMPSRPGYAEQTGLLTQSGFEYLVTLQCYANPSEEDGTLYLQTKSHDGTWTSFAALDSSRAQGTFQTWEAGSFIASGSTTDFRIEVLGPFEGSSTWVVDNVSVTSRWEDEMAAKLRSIKAALAAYLRTITVANGFALDIGMVHETKVGAAGLGNLPAVEVLLVGESKSFDEAVFGGKSAVVTIGLQCWSRGDTAEQTLVDLSAEIEKCIEPVEPGTTALGLSYVDEVVVTEKDLTDEITEGEHRGMRLLAMVVQVLYGHERSNP